ncbi:hypothetical protein DERF_013161 [Dermatophagoides farinae]|uniref:Uncharacterized protein n=1 Tax=Dermatophagoides farinae TaxID=6954 RepID=A0A922HLH1_DERFA|nr:hypothetical protein DERF_013161 [Dermatophagoides farinae]
MDQDLDIQNDGPLHIHANNTPNNNYQPCSAIIFSYIYQPSPSQSPSPPPPLPNNQWSFK